MDVKPAIIFLLLVPSVLGLSVDLQINDVIDGKLEWFNTTSFGPQKYSVTWFNTGSYRCITRPRLDFFNGSRIYTAWGDERVMSPGDTFTWELYSYLEPGEYDYNLTMYHCNEIYTFPNYSISVAESSPIEGLSIINSFATDSEVSLQLRSRYDLKDVVIIPKQYPLNWEFEPVLIKEIGSGQTVTASLKYKPIDWEGKSVTFVAATEDGNYAEEKPVILRRKESSLDAVVFVVFMLAAVMIYLYFKKPSFLLWKR